MAEPKTKATNASVDTFLNAIDDEQRRDDCHAVAKLFTELTGQSPVMWGSSIVGFGVYKIPAGGGKFNDWPRVAFSPRKQNLTLYLMAGVEGNEALMNNLGKFKAGKGCIYIKKLADIDLQVLKKLIQASYAYMMKKYPPVAS